ncbi:MAG: hypothetical protein IPK56_10840 [Elusimicrobia bacterium]|nr:hypothetical protein [Elusimicrobiota bacterium]
MKMTPSLSSWRIRRRLSYVIIKNTRKTKGRVIFPNMSEEKPVEKKIGRVVKKGMRDEILTERGHQDGRALGPLSRKIIGERTNG